MSKFFADVSDLEASQCLSCTHKHGGLGTCDAYPRGIPAAIIQNQVDHSDPYRGDQGIQWEDADNGIDNPLGPARVLREKADLIADILGGLGGPKEADGE